MLKSYKIYTCTNGALGLHLSRAPWDPYPWVSSIQKESNSYQAGLRIGDCLLELNGQDVLGMKISQIAALLKNHWLNESSNHVIVLIWRNKCNNKNNSNATDACNNDCSDNDDDDEDEENNAHNINQQSLQKFATCLQHIAQLLECPVCLEVIKPPGWQCCNGHVLCNNCRIRSEKCPVCRVPLGPRGRCLLSDKLFTLLADNFPCDGVRNNKSSPKDRRKCATEFHNQPKMAIVEKHQYQRHQQQQNKEEQAAKKAKDFLLTSLRRRRRRKISNSKSCNEENLNGSVDAVKQEEISHSSMQKQAMYDSNVVVTVVSNRKPSSDYNSGDVTTNATTTTQHQPGGNVNRVIATTAAATVQQCHCVTCYKLDKVAIVNNVATTLTQSLNKYILRIQSQGDCITATPIIATVNNEEIYQNYQCPTGKLCCLKNVNVMSHVVNNPTPIPSTAMTNNNLSAAIKQIQGQEQLDRVYNFQKTLTNEWDILAHLTLDHQLPVQQYYGEYGQRIYVQCVTQQLSIACLNLKGTENLDSKVEKFFIACIPLEMYSSSIVASKMAIFVYHMNTATTFTFSNLKDEVSNFETIIENPLTGIKWFGCAHPLTTPWSLILEKQHFLEYNVLSSHQHHRLSAVSVSVNQAAEMEADVIEADTFVFIIKQKLETKTKS